jgi:hypothetical protein
VRCGAETDPHRIEIRVEILPDGIQSKIPTIFRTSMKSAAREKEEEKRRKRRGGGEEEEEKRRERKGGTCGEIGVRRGKV